MFKSQKTKRAFSNWLRFGVGVVIAFIIIAPLLITFFASVKTATDMVMTNALWFPPLERLTFNNYITVLQEKLLPYAVRNTTILVIVSLILNITIGSMLAYVLERFDFPMRRVIFLLFFAAMLIPTSITEIARFKVINSLGLYNSLAAPIFIYIASDLTQLYIYRQFVSTIPVSLDESAIIDGCSYWKLYWQIIFPLLKPATATLVIIKSISIINDMYVPYLYMPKQQLKTLTTFLMAYANAESGSWQNLSAAVMIILIPSLIFYIAFQGKIMSGLVAGSVKE